MKKFLLSLVVACMAMTANAQQLSVAVKPLGNDFSKKFEPKAMNATVSDFAKADLKDFSAAIKSAKSGMKKAASAASLAGEYVQDDVEDIHVAYSAAIDETSVTGEDGTTYNVVVDLCGGFAEMYGVLDGDSIVIPAQYCHTVDANDSYYSSLGECSIVIYGMYPSGNGFSLDGDGHLVFDINEDGTLALRSEGYILIIDGGSYDGYYITYGLGTSLVPANASQDYYYAGQDWTENEATCGVVDYQDMVGIYNFLGFGGYCEMIVNEDLTVTMATGQLQAESSDAAQEAGCGDYFKIVAVKDTTISGESYITYDGDAAEVTGGVLSGNTISFYKAPFIWGTDYAENVGFYGVFVNNYTLTLNEGKFLADGIKEVNGTREDKIKNTKTYNLMGQQVNRDSAKGLLIYGGKKYIKK